MGLSLHLPAGGEQGKAALATLLPEHRFSGGTGKASDCVVRSDALQKETLQ